MRVLVCGGRTFTDREKLFEMLDRLHQRRPISLIVHGGAAGADTLAGEWAVSRGIKVRMFAAAWEKYGSKAGPKRNRQMLEDGKPDWVVAMPGGHGTAHMVRIAKQAGVFVQMPMPETALAPLKA